MPGLAEFQELGPPTHVLIFKEINKKRIGHGKFFNESWV